MSERESGERDRAWRKANEGCFLERIPTLGYWDAVLLGTPKEMCRRHIQIILSRGKGTWVGIHFLSLEESCS